MQKEQLMQKTRGCVHARRSRHGHLAALAAGTALAAATFITSAPASTGPARAADITGLNCSAYQLSVAIADPGPADQTLWGQLCYRGHAEPRTVQLLVHGATYNHAYWDFPYGDGYYSYVDKATAAGYATFNVDRIGDGHSSHPPSSEVSVSAGAVALHDAITALRSGAVDGHAFRHVIWVGHSYGSIYAWFEISRYHDVDAAILTGALHALNPDISSIAATDIYPAIDDPLFAGSGLDPGYLTTTPGNRGTLFYYPATADPNVVALDQATKDTMTFAELNDLPEVSLPADEVRSQQITVPVLLVDGQYDSIFCVNVTQYNCADRASVQAFESQYYPPQAHLKVVTIADTGHDLALSTTAPLADAAMIGWSLATVAP